MKNAEHIRMAGELVPEFNRLLSDWLRSDMRAESKEHRDLSRFLWDNKIGLLRLVEVVADKR